MQRIHNTVRRAKRIKYEKRFNTLNIKHPLILLSKTIWSIHFRSQRTTGTAWFEFLDLFGNHDPQKIFSDFEKNIKRS